MPLTPPIVADLTCATVEPMLRDRIPPVAPGWPEDEPNPMRIDIGPEARRSNTFFTLVHPYSLTEAD